MLAISIPIVLVILFLTTLTFTAFFLRRVVPTNMMHIVQSKSKTISYGFGQKEGNVYYAWPAFLPVVGVTVTPLSISNFEIEIKNYEAYDKDRVPFIIDVVGFFQISDTSRAAARIIDARSLRNQLTFILQGAIRTVLAQYDINQIMGERATFGDAFTKEVSENLAQWGVTPVKNVELMDIQDAPNSNVIRSIMQMKTAEIDAKSRATVANAKREAERAEIDAQRDVDMRRLETEKTVQEQNALTKREIELAKQRAQQAVSLEQTNTNRNAQEAERELTLKKAEIARDAAVISAEQEKRVAVVAAEARLRQQELAAQELILKSEAELKQQELRAKGITATGEANASAERAKLLAPVEAQLKLAAEIGSNKEYQQYLVSLEALKTALEVGTEQAKSLAHADVKIFSTVGGTPVDGVQSVGQLVNPNGGLQIAGMIEALLATPTGEKVLKAVANQSTPSKN